MRKSLYALVCCVLLCIIPLCSLAEMGTVTASALVVRAGPGLEEAMLGELPQGAEISILGEENGWYRIVYDGVRGYVHARYVRIALPEAGSYVPQPTQQPYATAPQATKPAGGLMPALDYTSENNPSYPRVMKPGDVGNSVIDLQKTLAALGYYKGESDGQYGYDTQAAVMRLQTDLSIDNDGIVGPQTRRLIGRNEQGVELLDWWLGGNVAYARLTNAYVVDVQTGKRFAIYRYGGDSHIDAEPITAQDTAIFLSICGGTWTWDRRPVWLEVDGRVIAASMNCMPHGGQHLWNNDFNGQFCIHLFGSHTHETDRVDEQHAACILEAYRARDRYQSK